MLESSLPYLWFKHTYAPIERAFSLIQAYDASLEHTVNNMGSCHKRQKPQAPIRNRQTRKVANAKGLNRNTNLA